MTLDNFLKTLKGIGSEKIVAFIGSGFVRDLGYPSWPDLMESAAVFAADHDEAIASLIRARLKKNELFAAGDLLFEQEIPVSDLHSFFRDNFDRTPPLKTVHKRLASCPLAGFITTNFDRTIEQSLMSVGKTPEPISDAQRFQRFLSRLVVYAAPPRERRKQGLDSTPVLQRLSNGPILKIHGDISCPDQIVLGTRQLEKLLDDESFNFFYRQLLTSYTLLFIGYSGNDANFKWHCDTILSVCGVPKCTSYFLHPDHEPAPAWLKNANIVSVPYSVSNNHKQLSDTIQDLVNYFKRPEVLETTAPTEEVSESRLDTLAFLCAGLSEDRYTSSYLCAVNSMVAETAQHVGSLDDEPVIVGHLARTYHVSMEEAQRLFKFADKSTVQKLLKSRGQAIANFNARVAVIKEGIAKRAKAIEQSFEKSAKIMDQIVVGVLVKALSGYSSGLVLSLLDTEAPEASVVDRVVRATIDQLNISGIGSLDKEILAACFADMFTHPTNDEGLAIISLAQAALAHSLATTFSGGLQKILDLLPKESYLDANVAIAIVVKDHPRSSYYHDLVVRLMRIGCDVYMLDIFLNEMEHHCELASEEVSTADIKNAEEARDYADFHGPLWINAFLAAFAAGGVEEEDFPSYLERTFQSYAPREFHFKKALLDLGIKIIDSSTMNRSPSEALAMHIASEKGKLTKLKAQILAEHEAQQILWMHQRENLNAWFITEDAALRRILRALPKLDFSPHAPSQGVMPAQGAFLLITSLADRPSLEGTFVQLLWNPIYVEMVDSMMASVLRKMPEEMEKLKKGQFQQLRERIIDYMRKEMERSERNDLNRRVKEYKLGKPELIRSILRELREQK